MVTLMTRMTASDLHSLGNISHESQGDGLPALGPLGESTAQNLVQLFKLLSDETRLKILHYLMQKDELNVRTLCKLLKQSQPAVSHHLALLKEAGVIECRRDGKHNFYHLVPKRCQQFLDMVFAVTDNQVRKVRVEDALLTYSREVQVAS
jgi:ArsR family transcriptional regulator, arsenate/arsenite/antimonite-responsive transcriptional repressor